MERVYKYINAAPTAVALGSLLPAKISDVLKEFPDLRQDTQQLVDIVEIAVLNADKGIRNTFLGRLLGRITSSVEGIESVSPAVDYCDDPGDDDYAAYYIRSKLLELLEGVEMIARDYKAASEPEESSLSAWEASVYYYYRHDLLPTTPKERQQAIQETGCKCTLGNFYRRQCKSVTDITGSNGPGRDGKTGKLLRIITRLKKDGIDLGMALADLKKYHQNLQADRENDKK